MDIKQYWNKLDYIKRLEFIKDLECTRDFRKVALDGWIHLNPIERKLIQERYFMKEIKITFKLSTNEYGFNAIKQEFYNFLKSKDWNYKDIKISYK